MKFNKTNKTVAIHQPNFFPWMGYFYKMVQCDVFVFLDDVAFSKGSYTSRVMIHHSEKDDTDVWINVGIIRPKLNTPIKEVQFISDEKWVNKILDKLEQTYKSARYFDEGMSVIARCFSGMKDSDRLSEMNQKMVLQILDYLGIKRTVKISSEMDVSSNGVDKLVKIIKELKGDRYLSGMGGQKYMDVALFKKNNIEVDFSDYVQFAEGKIPTNFLNKSIIAYLMYYSKGEIRALLQAEN